MSKMTRPLPLLALFSAIALAPASTAQVVYNTGVDDLGVVLAVGQSDPHYLGFEGPPKVIDAGALWIPNSTTSAWVKSVKKDSNFDYFYTSFDLTGYDPAKVTVSFKWSIGDTSYGYITLNTDLDQPSIVSDPTQFTETTLTKGFVPGVNGLEFLLLHNNPLYMSAGALRLEGFKINAVPEPETWGVVFAAGLMGFALWRRRANGEAASLN